MPYPSDSARVVIRGTLGGGEIFETGFGVLAAGIASEAAANAYAASIAGVWNGGAIAALTGILNNGGAYTEVRVYAYPSGGTTATYVGSAPIASSPGLSSVSLPDQVCMVVTLKTGLSGRRNRGRMYLPATGATMASAGLFSSTQRDSVVDTLAARLSAVNALSDTATVAVISSVGTTAHPILTVSADQRPDIQRRRANRQAVGTSHSATVTV